MPAAVFEGDLSAFRLPDVLTFLETTRKSGTLTLTHDAREVRLYFDSGALIFASSNQEPFRLGSILLRKKKITIAQRARIDSLMLREGGQFGRFAVQEGVMSEEQLRDFLKIQVSEIVYDAFVWDGGHFSFAASVDLPSYAVTITIDLANLIMEGARRIEEWEQCLKLLPNKSIVFRVVATPRDEKITLTADEWKVLFMINGQRTLEELAGDSDDPLHVYRVVYGLFANKLIETTALKTSPDETDDAILADATMKQGSPRFGAESTVRDHDAGDDTSLLVSSDARLSYTDVVRTTVAQLKHEDGTLIPLIEPEYLVGRHRDNGIQLSDPGVSSFHARLYRGADGYVLEDLKSRNGTWVNGTRVQQATLQNGDRVHFGQTDLIYEVVF